MCKAAQFGPGRPHAGISVFVRDHLSNAVSISSRNLSSGIMVVRLAASLLPTLDSHAHLICCYFTPTPRLDAVDPFDALAIVLSSLGPRPHVLVVGDINARTAQLPDTSQHTDSHLLPPSLDEAGDRPWATPPPARNNMDSKTNSYGHSCVQLCQGHSLAILNGRSPGDPNGAFTYQSKTGQSAPDMLLASEHMFSLVQHLDMGSFSMWCTPARQSPNPRRSTSLKLSDHVPSTIGLSAPSSSNPSPLIANPHPKRQHRRFSLNLWPLYAAAVSSDPMQLRLTTVISNLTLSSTGSSAAVAAIAGIVAECEQAAFATLAAPQHSGAPWWDKASFLPATTNPSHTLPSAITQVPLPTPAALLATLPRPATGSQTPLPPSYHPSPPSLSLSFPPSAPSSLSFFPPHPTGS
ncbi:MAG: hypothetical protein WDW36_007917 [Sanguina aurantia]